MIARRPWLVLAGWLAGCSLIVDPALPPPDATPHTAPDASIDATPEADATPDAGCADPDGDGYGAGCPAGPDCAESDPRVHMPSDELCNGIDDDCDGIVDEPWPTLGAWCTAPDPDGCLRGGTRRCVAPDAVGCALDPGPPGAELCNGADDDCDGAVDEGATAGEPCESGLGACRRAGLIACDGPLPRCVAGDAPMPSPEACNGIDDDCDGSTDEGLGIGGPCSAGVGGCERFGERRCAADGSVACTATPGFGIPEVCNAFDDDCDGALDEDFDLTTDREHCGMCGLACAADDVCAEGRCRPAR